MYVVIPTTLFVLNVGLRTVVSDCIVQRKDLEWMKISNIVSCKGWYLFLFKRKNLPLPGFKFHLAPLKVSHFNWEMYTSDEGFLKFQAFSLLSKQNIEISNKKILLP